MTENKKIDALLLFKIQLINQYRLNGRGQKKRPNPALVALLCIALIFPLNSFAVAASLARLGMADLIPAYAAAACGIAALFFTLLKTNGFLFGFRDYDLLMSLPVSTESVVASRFLMVYLNNFIYSLCLVLPMAIAHVAQTGAGPLIYLNWLIGIFTIPLIPTALGALLGAAIMAAATRFRHAKALSTVLTLVLLITTLVLSMSAGSLAEGLGTSDDLSRLGTQIYDAICRLYPPADLFGRSFAPGGWGSFLLFFALSIAACLLLVVPVAARFKNINTALMGQVKKSGYRLSRSTKAASPLMALFRKEWKRFLGSTVYLTNAGVGAIMCLIMAIALTILGPQQMERALGFPGFGDIFEQIMPYLLGATLAMSCTSCSSLSLEGKHLWILQSAPLTAKTVYDSKILVNLSLCLPVALASSLMLALRFQTGAAQTVFLFIFPVTCSFFSALWGMHINIRLPRFDWETEVYVVKQSSAVLVGMMGGTLLILVLMGINYLTVGFHPLLMPMASIALLWVAIIVLYRGICRQTTLPDG